jgi:lysine 2-monooxygenase
VTSAVPATVHEVTDHVTCASHKPITMYGPDFPFAYDDYVSHPAGLGSIPEAAHGTEVAVVGGGLSGLVAAYELLKLGLKPVVYEADQLGGRMRSTPFPGVPGTLAEMGAMRFPPSSTTLFEYFEKVGLATEPFPNPLDASTPSTVIDLKGQTHYATVLDDLPAVYHEVADAWADALDDPTHGAEFSAMQQAIRERDTEAIRAIWGRLVPRLDDTSFYGFLAQSPAFKSFRHREVFGQVGFGTGGWDTDFPNSMLEILRVVYTGADDHHRRVVGGCQQLPLRLWSRTPSTMAHWPAGTTVQSLHPEGVPHPAVTRMYRTARGITITDSSEEIRTYQAAVFTAQSWMILSKIKVDEALLPTDVWTAVERTHYMGASKLFVVVDRPFWLDPSPADPSRHAMSMTLTDRMPRGVYLLDEGPDKPAVMCLSYTWVDDSMKFVPLSREERLDIVLASLAEIYPGVDIRSHIIGTPLTVSWETEPYFMGAFKANLPGQYRYQRRLYTHFMQDGLPESQRGLFLAGDDISWTAGWAEGAVTTALNAVWGVMHQLGGTTSTENPGPGDVFEAIAPPVLEEG